MTTHSRINIESESESVEEPVFSASNKLSKMAMDNLTAVLFAAENLQLVQRPVPDIKSNGKD